MVYPVNSLTTRKKILSYFDNGYTLYKYMCCIVRLNEMNSSRNLENKLKSLLAQEFHYYQRQ